VPTQCGKIESTAESDRTFTLTISAAKAVVNEKIGDSCAAASATFLLSPNIASSRTAMF